MLLRQFICTAGLLASLAAWPQTPSGGAQHCDASGVTRSEQEVQINQSPQDNQIASRLQKILAVTGWYKNLKVTSTEGIVRLRGQTAKASHSDWAEDLAGDTDGVVAVINEIQVTTPRWFDLRPARDEAETLVKRSVAFLPYLFTGILIFCIAWIVAGFAGRIGRRAAQQRIHNPLLVEIVAKLTALPVLVIGLYLVLRISGLDGIAATVLGGTGAVGIVAGLAMKNILENYFSGIMLSLRNPYNIGDVVELGGKMGVVQELTTRGTILVDFDGNHIIIPNTTIFGNVITNFTANPSIRQRFALNIGYQDSTSKAREIILDVLKNTEGILAEPEMMVVAEDFLPSAVKIGVYFWIDGKKTSGVKIKSLVMETVKARLQEAGISLPGEVRQLVFPQGIPEPGKKPEQLRPRHEDLAFHPETSAVSDDLLREANKGRPIDHGERLM